MCCLMQNVILLKEPAPSSKQCSRTWPSLCEKEILVVNVIMFSKVEYIPVTCTYVKILCGISVQLDNKNFQYI